MLKIKDNVDLKELEKFGFEAKGTFEIMYYKKETKYLTYWVDKTLRTMEMTSEVDEDVQIDDTLYDLIQAGLVEKVGE